MNLLRSLGHWFVEFVVSGSAVEVVDIVRGLFWQYSMHLCPRNNFDWSSFSLQCSSDNNSERNIFRPTSTVLLAVAIFLVSPDSSSAYIVSFCFLFGSKTTRNTVIISHKYCIHSKISLNFFIAVPQFFYRNHLGINQYRKAHDKSSRAKTHWMLSGRLGERRQLCDY